MNNKTGYVLGFLSTVIYVIVAEGVRFNDFLGFIAVSLGAALIPAIIAGLIAIFTKGRNFGKVFGITCVAVYISAFLGNL